MSDECTDIYLLTYLGKPVDAHVWREAALAEMASYTADEQSVMEVVAVRLVCEQP